MKTFIKGKRRNEGNFTTCEVRETWIFWSDAQGKEEHFSVIFLAFFLAKR